MKAKVIMATFLLISLCLITPLPILATGAPIINGQMDTNESWVHWFSDQTWTFKGYPCHQQSGNTLCFDAYYLSDSSNLYFFISTDDNTVGFTNRDKFTVYFDIFPYGRGPEDIAYAIEPPTSLYGEGLKLHGPNWSHIEPYDGIAADSTNGHRTYEIAIPLRDLAPNRNNVNYRTAKFLIYLENYGALLWGEHKVVNYHPDKADVSNYWKRTDLWQQIDLTALCPSYFNIQSQRYSLSVNTLGGGSVVLDPDQSSYISGTTVQLTANPNVGWQFAGWSGDLTGSTNPATLTLNQNKAVAAAFTQIPYNLTVTAIGTGCSVNTSPNQASYHYGDNVTITPIAASGWAFSGWIGDLSGNTNPATLTIDGNKLVIANFAQNNYSLAVAYVGDGSGQVFKNGTGAYHNGDVVQLTAVADGDSSFSGWSGDLSGNANPAYITIYGNKAVTASFTKNQYTLTVNTIGMGSVTKNPTKSTYTYGTIVQLTAISDAGWSFAGWSGDLIGNTNPASINLTDNKSVYATFIQEQYCAIISTIGQGNPTITPNQPTYAYGSIVQLAANPLAGWSFSHWTTSTPEVIIDNPSQALTAATINGEGTITAVYTQNTYSLTVNVNPTQGGAVTVDNPGPYHYGDIVTLTETPAAGYSFSGWSGDGQGTGTTCAITIDGNKIVNANFEQTDYAITVTINPSIGGLVLVDKNTPYHYGDIVTLTAQPNAGYSFSGWNGAGSGTETTIQLTMTNNLAITASFTQKQYQLTLNVIGDGCSVTKSSNGPYQYGDTVTLTANSGAGWSFSGWSGDISGTANPATITINGNIIVNAIFTKIEYKLNVVIVSGHGGSFSFNQSEPYHYGDVVQITAIPENGYMFTGCWVWNGNGPTATIENSSFNIVMDSNYLIWAFFAEYEVNLTVLVNGGGYASGSPNGIYHYGDEVQITAVPNEGYVFAGWSDDLAYLGLDNPVSFQIYHDIMATANFVPLRDVPLLHLTPEKIVGPDPDVGDTFNITLRVENITNLFGWMVSMTWDSSVLQLIDASEGTFLSSAGETIFLENSYAVQGSYLPEMMVILFVDSKVTGSGDLAILTFKVLNYGETSVEITESRLLERNSADGDYLPIVHLTQKTIISIAPPPVRAPTAKFTLQNGGNCYVGDLLILDASSSLPGYDTLPVGHGTTNAITQYTWSIDMYNDGTVDMVLEGENVSVVIPYVGVTSITLTVTAPDSYLPTSQSYNQTGTVARLINVQSRPTKANLDVYTERGGSFGSQSSDAYGPQELVVIHALVTYNDAPVVGKDVVFQIFSGDGSQIYYRSERTDDNGVATVSFRLPWPDVNPEVVMGNWTIISNVDVSQQVVSDTCNFVFGYLINIDSIETLTSDSNLSTDFRRNYDLTANMTINSIRRIAVPAKLTLTVYDEANVPIAVTAIDLSVPAGESLSATTTLRLPSWAFVGIGTVYVNVYAPSSQNAPVPFCPEKIVNILIAP